MMWGPVAALVALGLAIAPAAAQTAAPDAAPEAAASPPVAPAPLAPSPSLASPVLSSTAESVYASARPRLMQVRTLITAAGQQSSTGSAFLVSADGLAIDFWEIAMRPGKPLMFGHYRGTPTVGLPGNPVSTLVCSLLFLKPALDKLSGLLPASAEPGATARLAVAVRQNDRRQDYLRARLVRAADGVCEAVPFEVQDSSMMRLLAASDCLVVRPPHAPALAAGSTVPIIPFPNGATPL
jgi:molybdopterin molybdotransferase